MTDRLKEALDSLERMSMERDARRKAATAWAKHGPTLLAAAKTAMFVAYDNPMVLPPPDWTEPFEDLGKAIAACEQIEGKDDD